jgi:hypothetical protein
MALKVATPIANILHLFPLFPLVPLHFRQPFALHVPLKVPKKDRPSGAVTMRVLAQVLRWVGHLYELQTKQGTLQSRYGTQSLSRIDQCTAEQDAKEPGNNRRKITLRHAAKAPYTGSSRRKKIYCGCSGDCQLARFLCYRCHCRCPAERSMDASSLCSSERSHGGNQCSYSRRCHYRCPDS